jgi:cytochrome c oxidase cbb3-type subunit 2
VEPKALVPESIMPPYRFLADRPLIYSDVEAHLKANRAVGVPYTDEMIANARADLAAQARAESDQGDLTKRYPKAIAVGETATGPVTELDALIAYIQMLGTLVNFADATQENVRQ